MALLDAMASSIDNQCWIQRVESKPVQATVHGLALDNAAAHRFASALEVGLQGSGWTVLPAETKLTEHHLVAFKIVLTAAAEPAQKDEGTQLSNLEADPLPAEPCIAGLTVQPPAQRTPLSADSPDVSSEVSRT
jgi:hypothetical protein